MASLKYEVPVSLQNSSIIDLCYTSIYEKRHSAVSLHAVAMKH